MLVKLKILIVIGFKCFIKFSQMKDKPKWFENAEAKVEVFLTDLAIE